MTDNASPAAAASGQGVPDHIIGTGMDVTVPHSARIWNYWLGGKDNYAVDRAAGDQFSAIYPGIVEERTYGGIRELQRTLDQVYVDDYGRPRR